MKSMHVLVLGIAVGVASTTAVSIKVASAAKQVSFLDSVNSRVPHEVESGRQVLFLFRPSDCASGAFTFDTLNVIAEQPGVVVRAVMLDAPPDTNLASQLAEQFGARFRIEVDQSRRWSRAITASHLVLPLLVVRDERGIISISHAAGDTQSSVLLTGLAGGSDALRRGLSQRPKAPPRRVFVKRNLQLVRRLVGASNADLQRPELVAASPTGDAIVYDYATRRVSLVSMTGYVEWSYGDRDRDSTFVNPTDLKVGGDIITLVDPAARSLTQLALDGRLLRRIRMMRGVHQIVLLAHGEFAGYETTNQEALGAVFDSSGRVVGELPTTPELLRLLNPVRATRIASLPGSDSIAIVYQRAGFISLANPRGGAPSLLEGVEAIPFPRMIGWKEPDGQVTLRVDPNAPLGALAVQADADRVFVLFAGMTDNASRLIDVYRRRDGKYVESYLLPEKAIAFARTPHGFVTVSESVAGGKPVIAFWRLKKASAAQRKGGAKSNNTTTYVPDTRP